MWIHYYCCNVLSSADGHFSVTCWPFEPPPVTTGHIYIYYCTESSYCHFCKHPFCWPLWDLFSALKFQGHKSMFTVTASFQFNNGTVTVAEYSCMWRFRKSLIWGTLKPGVRWFTKVTQSGSGLILCGVILQGMLTNTLGAQRSGQPTSKHFWSNDLILGTCTCQLTGHLGMV